MQQTAQQTKQTKIPDFNRQQDYTRRQPQQTADWQELTARQDSSILSRQTAAWRRGQYSAYENGATR
jgi:hypothetical protein